MGLSGGGECGGTEVTSRKDGEVGQAGGNGIPGNRRFLGSLDQRVTARTSLGDTGDASYGQPAGLSGGPEPGSERAGVLWLKWGEAGEPHGGPLPSAVPPKWARAERFANPNLALGVLEVGEMEKDLASQVGFLLPFHPGLAVSITENPLEPTSPLTSGAPSSAQHSLRAPA